ncbi:MAG: GNAT family N-acetyltransferase [Actinomycetota bacterium]
MDQPSLVAAPDVRLRPWTVADAPALVAAFSDEAIQRWNIQTMLTAAEAAEWIAPWHERWAAETDASWAVTDDGGRDLLGYVALRGMDLEFGVAKLTYWVVHEHRGRGVATRAASEITRWALDDLGLHRLTLYHSVANRASCGVAGKLGFSLEGVMRSALLHADGWHDMHIHGRVGA